MAKLRFLFKDEEEEKEKFGWEQRTRGIGELPEFEIPESTKLKFTADIGLGIGARAEMDITLPEAEVIPSIGVTQRMRGIGEPPEKYGFEGITIDMKKAQKKFGQLWRSEFLTTEDKWKFLKHKNWSPELIQANREAMILSEQASRMGVNIKDWINYGVYMVFFSSMAASILPALSGLPKNILDNLLYKVEGKTVKGKELLKVLQRVTYPDPRAGFGAPSKFDRKIFDEFVKQGGLRGIGKNLKTGITIPRITPRFAFGTKLYAGLPVDEIVKSLVATGRVTADMARELSLAKPELVSQVIQNLSIASPAIASKLAPELVRLMPEVKKEVPTVKPEIKEERPKVEPKEPWQMTKKEYIGETIWTESAKNEHIKSVYQALQEGKPVPPEVLANYPDLKVEPKPPVEPTIPELTEREIVPATIEEAKEILKVDPKKPSVPKIKLAEEMVKKKVSLADIEAVKGEKIDVKKPRDIIIALRDIKAVKKKVVVKEEIPKVEIKKPEIELATPEQIKKIHAIASSKGMISPKGKMKPQYRALGKAVTEKVSSKKMTPEEAEIFVDALNRLPEPRVNKKTGELIPPTIPRTTKLVLQDFFKRKYKEPTPLRYLTPQTYYAEMLGIKPLVEPYEIGKQKFDLEFRDSSRTADQIIDKLNKIAKTPLGEKLKSKVKNIPTKVESNMAELVDKYDEAPAELEQGLKDVFNWYRSLSRDIWNRENKVRESVDLPPIKYRKAYFRHTADGMAKEMLEGKYPFPQGLKYWAEKMTGKKIFNPMEFQRKLSDDLVDLWSKDLRSVTRSMLWYGLKEIHLAQPAKFLSEQLNAISKDLPEYKNLSPRDQAAYDQTRVMPASTKKWLINYVNQVMKGQETELDASLNRIVTQTGLRGLFNKVLSPFGRSLGRKPITNVFQFGGRVTISGVMGWVPRQIIRNVFQQVQNLALCGVKATVKSFLPASIDKNLKGLLSDSLFLKSYTGFEELPTNLMGKLEKVWLGPYGIVACWNASQGMKAAYWSTLNLIKNPKYKNLDWADPARTKDTPRDKLYPSEKEKLLKEMEYSAGATQYQYIPMGMPEVFRYKTLIPVTRLQSWWMNYFTKFTREAIYRGIKGETGYGQKLPWSYRVNYLKYIIIGGAILMSLGYRRSFLLGVLPTYISPAGQVALGFYNYATAISDWQRQRALRQIKYSWTAFIPGSLAWKDFTKVWNGEKDLKDLFFYKKIEKEEKKKVPLKITMPKGGKLKFIEIKPKKSTKLKFTF